MSDDNRGRSSLAGPLIFIAVCAIVAAAAFWASGVRAQSIVYQVVSSCNTVTYSAGIPQIPTQDIHGNACTNSTGGGGSSNATIVGPLGSQTAAASVATTINGTATVIATADTHAQCAALCTDLIVKASAGKLKTFEVSADSTLSGAAWYVFVYDATTDPSDGAVTPVKCYSQTSGTTQMGGTLGPGGTNYTIGIVIGVSTTGCFTQTSSTHAFIAADYQ